MINQTINNEKEILLNKICHIGKRTFILASCGSASHSIQKTTTSNIESKIKKITHTPPLLSKFKPTIDGSCRSRLASEADEKKSIEIPPAKDITSEIVEKLQVNTIWKGLENISRNNSVASTSASSEISRY